MKIRFANKNDSNQIILLDKQVFPDEWIVSDNFIQHILSENPFTYRVLEDDKKIKGYYCLFPLKKVHYEAL